MPLCCQQQYKLMELQKKNFSITTQRQFPVVVLTAVSSASAFSCASFCQRPSSPSPPFDELNRWTTVWINELVKNAFNVFLMTCQVGTHPPTKSVAPAAAKAAAKSKGHPFFYSSNLFCFVLVPGTLKPIPAQLVAQERRVKSSFSSRLSWFLSTSIKRMIFFCECIVAFHI